MTRKPMIAAFVHGIMLAVLCVISYMLITHMLILVPVSRDDDLLGGMWAVVATVFVYRYASQQSVAAALSRTWATCMSFALCLLYLLVFPFNVYGMSALIGLGAIIMFWLGRPDDVITTGITTAVVMVVAAISPHAAWKEPILRLIDTLVGTGVAIVGAWITLAIPRIGSLFVPEVSMSKKSAVGDRGNM